ncbi:MAG: hypothetical protein Q4D12_09580 [Bacteroidales bacterium]|nr:hypothetical protein [Bacteroidales bacterium]
MKKLVFMFVAMAAVSFASCGGNANGEATEAEVDSTVVEEVAPVDSAACCDSCATDTTVAE